MNKNKFLKIGIAVCLVIFAVLARLLPHPPNMTPVAASALFAGTYLGGISWVVPIITMLATDAIIGWYSLPIMFSVYLSFIASAAIGGLIKDKVTPIKVLGSALGGSILFFIVTNGAVWIWGNMYPLTLSGLIACYTAALPFFRNTLIGDMIFSVILFGSYALIINLVKIKMQKEISY